MHRRTFRVYGGVAHLHLRDAADLAEIETLDKARWASTSVPCAQFNCDPRFLGYLDADGDGRVRLYDVRAARRWFWEHVRDRSGMDEGSAVLHLARLDPAHPETRDLTELAQLVVQERGATATDRVSLEQVRGYRDAYCKSMPNGDGVITVDQVQEPALQQGIARILAGTGGVPDASSQVGVGRAQVDAYVDAARAFIAWSDQAEGPDAAPRMPLGSDTRAAAELVGRLRPKMEQFFAQCALVALEAGAHERLRASPEALEALDVDDADAIQAWLGKASIARPAADGVLRLDHALNPHFVHDLTALAQDVGPRLLDAPGPLTELRQAQWRDLCARLAPFIAWRDARPAGVEPDAEPAALSAFVEGPVPERLRGLCAQDAAVAEEVRQLDNLEKLILFQQGLLEFARNMVEMRYLFDLERPALFQEGTLVIDGRKVRLCMKVLDPATHRAIAKTSLMFLAYVDLTRRDAQGAVQKAKVVAAVTAGVRGGIGVGKRGVFYDRRDQEWDAVVTDVEVQPISLWEAMLAPFVRVKDAVAARIKAAGDANLKALEADVAEHAHAAAGTAGEAKPAAPPPGQGAQRFQNALVGGSIAVAALASASAFVVQVFTRISLTQVLGVVAGVVALLVVVSAAVGWLRLRRRDLSTFLEAAGFALNGRMRLTRYLASTFTLRPRIPKGSALEQGTPRSPLAWIATLGVALICVLGALLWWNPALLHSLLALVTPGE